MRPQHGSRLTGPHGNNAFAYDERKRTDPEPRLRLPGLKQISSIDEIQLGSDAVFAELDTDKNVVTYTGLKHLYRARGDSPLSKGGAEGGGIFIFDNHNYALYCWAKHLIAHISPPVKEGSGEVYTPNVRCIHIDQHSDMGDSATLLPPDKGGCRRQGDLFTFDQVVYNTNVGNFIRPALDSGLISECIWIKNQYDLEHFPPLGKGGERLISSPLSKGGAEGGGIFLLDIDLDFRAPQMETDLTKTIPLVQSLMKHASCITIATSPYFLDQTYALELLHLLFSQTHSDIPHTEDTNSKI